MNFKASDSACSSLSFSGISDFEIFRYSSFLVETSWGAALAGSEGFDAAIARASASSPVPASTVLGIYAVPVRALNASEMTF